MWVNTTYVEDKVAQEPDNGGRDSNLERLSSLPEVTFTHRCRIHLFAVTNLEKRGTIVGSVSRDPYVRITLTLPGNRTKVIDSTKVRDCDAPVWDPPFVFDLSFDMLPGTDLTVEVFDWDFWFEDTSIGFAKVSGAGA